jgi:antitoxin component HigA of HigAB toxin-antitoxin module
VARADYRAALKEIEALMSAERRPLTLAMIQRRHSEVGIPAESLIKQSERRSAA